MMRKFENAVMPLGMVGVVAYLLHTTLGRLLWPTYNPITTDISSLTAIGAPNRGFLMIFTSIYGIATILFVIGMLVKSFRKYHGAVRAGWMILLIMNLVCMFGYALFPLSGNKTNMSFTNLMHIGVTVIVVFTTIAAGFVLAIGYWRQERMRKLGFFSFIMAMIITLTGALNPIGMSRQWNVLGLTERAVIYTLQLMMFIFSAYYTFSKTEKS